MQDPVRRRPEVRNTCSNTSRDFGAPVKTLSSRRVRITESLTPLDSSTASIVPTNSEERPLVPRPFLLCSMKCGFARSTVQSGPLTSTSRGRIHIPALAGVAGREEGRKRRKEGSRLTARAALCRSFHCELRRGGGRGAFEFRVF